MKKIYVLLISIFLINTNLFSKNSFLKGIVNENNKIPISSVLISIKPGNMKIYTDQNGKFIIKKIPFGKYKLKFHHLGFQTKDTTITINSKDTISLNIFMSVNDVMTDEVVVTGTRTLKEIENNPIPTQVITDKDVKNNGGTRLDEILMDQTGLNVTEFLGKGVQIQGLDESYALILLNGEPVIGTMSGGQFNLDRFAIGNIERVEIVKGPSSSLYGSNALAGVINLITKEPNHTLRLNTEARYGSFNTKEISSESQFNLVTGKLGFNLFADYKATDGYKTNKNLIRNTVPKDKNYTLSSEIFYNFSPKTKAILRARYNNELQENQFMGNDNILNNEEATLIDQNYSIIAKHRYSPSSSVKATLYHTSYDSETSFFEKQTGDLSNFSYYNQGLSKFELIADRIFYTSHLVTYGAGINLETVESDIVENKNVKAQSYFAYAQEDWVYSDQLDLIASLRYDDHSDYSYHFSPKVAFSWEPVSDLTFKASVGNGFKAPTTEQLYLNWQNPTEGYSVFGVKGVIKKLDELKGKGLISDFLIDPSMIKELNPEKSWSYNLGLSYLFLDNIHTNINFFRNNVSDMIEWQIVAEDKANLHRYFTYFNLNSVYTQGIEANIKFGFLKYFKMSFGYQFLQAYDNDIIQKIKNKEIYKVGSTGVTRPVQEVEYGGLWNRSKHTINLRLQFDYPKYGISAYVRGIIKSKLGYKDKNGNNILDDESEYIDGFQIWYLTASKDISKLFTLQINVKNLLDIKNKDILITPGRSIFLNLIFNYSIN